MFDSSEEYGNTFNQHKLHLLMSISNLTNELMCIIYTYNGVYTIAIPYLLTVEATRTKERDEAQTIHDSTNFNLEIHLSMDAELSLALTCI